MPFLEKHLFQQQAAKKRPRRPRFFESLPGISKNIAKILCCPLYRASKEHCKNGLWIMYEAKYSNIADFFEKHLFHQQPARNIRSLNTKRLPQLFHWSPAQERTRGDSSLWHRDTVPELPSAAKPPFVQPYLPAGGEFLELYVSAPQCQILRL